VDLIARLRRAAFGRPRLLVVAAPSAVAARLAVERYARERGWPTAESAADTDVLAVLGPVDDGLARVVSVLESQIPAPWIRVDLSSADEVGTELDRVPAQLAEWSPAARPVPGTIRDSAEPESHEQVADRTPAPGRRDGEHGEHGEHHGHQAPPSHGGHDGHNRPDDRGSAGHGGRHVEEPAGYAATAPGDQEPQHGAAGHEDRAAVAAQDRLADGGGQRMASHDGPGGHDMAGHGVPGHGDHEMAGHGGHEMAGHGGHDMGGHDMGGHGGHHDHTGPVAGLSMAGRAPDRDGLTLDVLHVPLGPVLPYWPAGLRLSLTVQGDVVQEAAVETLGVLYHAGPPFWDEPALRALAGEAVTWGEVARRRTAAHLDSLVRLLGVAGWDAAAARSAVLRDRALAGEPGGPLSADFARFRRRLLGSRVLRRMTCGLGVLEGATADRLGVTGPAATAAGDVAARLAQWVRAVTDDLARVDDRQPGTDLEGSRGSLDRPEPPSAALLAALPSLVVGAELAAVRLIVASLDPDLSELTYAREAVAARG
jgi:hypothetical protein